MSKVLAVFGATGIQGGSVINHVLNTPELSREYKIRAIARDTNSEKAKLLKEKNIEVVEGDMTKPETLKTALAGAHTVYIVTVPAWGPDPVETEANTAKMMADIAVEQGAQYLIFSTLPSMAEISGGRFTKVTPFEAKAKAEKYIRGLPVKTAFVALAFFMENLHAQRWFDPKPAGDGTWVLARPVPGEIKVSYIAAEADSGKYVGAILAAPDKFAGQTLCGAQAHYTLHELAAALGRSAGKKVVYKQITYEEFAKDMPFAPELWVEAWRSQEEFEYFGKETEKLCAWAAEQVEGRLTTLDEYLAAHPIDFE